MKRTIFATHTKIRNFLFVSVVIFVTLFVFLKGGISISHLKIASFNIEGLYLKLNKKFILEVDKVEIPKTKKQKDFDVERILEKVKRILDFFEYIQLKEVNFKNEHYTLLFTDKILYMATDEFEIASHQIERVGSQLQAVVDLLYIKRYDVRFSGKIVYNYKQDVGLIHGDAYYRDIKVGLAANKQKDRFFYVLKSNRFKELKPLIEKFGLSKSVSSWITDKVQAKSYQISTLKGTGRFDENSVDLMLDKMVAKATLKDATIYFQEGVKPVKAQEIALIFKDGNLYLNLLKPLYGKKSLSGSRVSIRDLAKFTKPMLTINLVFNSKLDKEIHKILKAYGIAMPIYAKHSTINSNLTLTLNLHTKELTFASNFLLKRGIVSVGKADFPVAGGDVNIKKNIVTLKRVLLKDKSLDATIDGTVDIKKQHANLTLNVKSLKLGEDKKSFMALKKSKVPVKLSFKKSTKITLPTLKTTINIYDNNNSMFIRMKDLNKISKSFTNLPIDIDGGYLTIDTKDYKKFHFQGVIKREGCFFYDTDSVCYAQVPIEGSFSDDALLLKAFDRHLIYDSKRSITKINNLNFDLKKYLEMSDTTNPKKDGKSLTKRMKVVATKSLLKYNKHTLVTDKYELGLLPNGNFHFRGHLGTDRVTVTRRGERLEIKATSIHDKMLHPLINFKGLQGGRYSVDFSGVLGENMKGTILLDGGLMRDFEAYNNLLAFINTLPALATFHSPGFNNKGFKIKQGVVKFSIIKGEKLFFDSVLIEGDSATISGDGVVDLKTKDIDVDLAIQTAKPMGKLISSLPIVGYILTGKNRSIMTVGLHIGGTLDKPKSKISPIKDVLMLPFKMLERTFKGKEQGN